MPVQLSDLTLELLKGRNLAHLGTLMADGSPHVTPVWILYEGDHLLITTVEGVVKLRNIRRDPRVAVEITDHEDPFVTATIQGRVVEITSRNASECVDRMAQKYLNKERYREPDRPIERVVVRIEPLREAARVVT